MGLRSAKGKAMTVNPMERLSIKMLRELTRAQDQKRDILRLQNFVVDGGMLKCSEGSLPYAIRVPTGTSENVGVQRQVHIQHYELENIDMTAFGLCAKRKERFKDQPSEWFCQVQFSGPWELEKEDTIIGGEAGITTRSELVCDEGGVITVLSDGQGAPIMPMMNAAGGVGRGMPNIFATFVIPIPVPRRESGQRVGIGAGILKLLDEIKEDFSRFGPKESAAALLVGLWYLDDKMTSKRIVVLDDGVGLAGASNATRAEDEEKSDDVRPEAAVTGSKKHGVNWKEGKARAKKDNKPQGQWAEEDLDFATEKANTLAPGESAEFDLPEGSGSIVHMPDGTTQNATKIWIRNNGTGTWHGYPKP